MAQWEQAGLATQREVVRVELGAKFVCWWKCKIGGYMRLGIRDWEDAASFLFIFFFNHKKKNMV